MNPIRFPTLRQRPRPRRQLSRYGSACSGTSCARSFHALAKSFRSLRCFARNLRLALCLQHNLSLLHADAVRSLSCHNADACNTTSACSYADACARLSLPQRRRRRSLSLLLCRRRGAASACHNADAVAASACHNADACGTASACSYADACGTASACSYADACGTPQFATTPTPAAQPQFATTPSPAAQPQFAATPTPATQPKFATRQPSAPSAAPTYQSMTPIASYSAPGVPLSSPSKFNTAKIDNFHAKATSTSYLNGKPAGKTFRTFDESALSPGPQKDAAPKRTTPGNHKLRIPFTKNDKSNDDNPIIQVSAVVRANAYDEYDDERNDDADLPVIVWQDSERQMGRSVYAFDPDDTRNDEDENLEESEVIKEQKYDEEKLEEQEKSRKNRKNQRNKRTKKTQTLRANLRDASERRDRRRTKKTKRNLRPFATLV